MDSLNLQIGTLLFNIVAIVILAIIGFFIKNYIKRDENTKKIFFEKLDKANDLLQSHVTDIQVIHGTLNTHKEHIVKIQHIQNKDHETIIRLQDG